MNERAVARPRRLIRGRQYVLDSNWGEVQPKAEDEKAFLASHAWSEYPEWHLGLTEGASEEAKARYAIRLRRLPPPAPHGPDRLPLPRRRVAEIELAAHELLQLLDRSSA